MQIDALLSSFIYLISSSLLYPDQLILCGLSLWLLMYAGSVFAEWVERARKVSLSPDELARRIKEGNLQQIYSHRIEPFFDSLRSLLENREDLTDAEIENLLQRKILSCEKSLDNIKMIIRIGPALGLIGTLIPMGTGLAALGQGDITRLSSDMVISLTTTVVGLAEGTLAYLFFTVKKRWVEKDILHMELITETLVHHNREERSVSPCRS